ncbi:hypothetical protein GBA52_026807 [Prunus armeniaca]|nr:hypothetical protein GBA52_026807 [Prunus armeniaca]
MLIIIFWLWLFGIVDNSSHHGTKLSFQNFIPRPKYGLSSPPGFCHTTISALYLLTYELQNNGCRGSLSSRDFLASSARASKELSCHHSINLSFHSCQSLSCHSCRSPNCQRCQSQSCQHCRSPSCQRCQSPSCQHCRSPSCQRCQSQSCQHCLSPSCQHCRNPSCHQYPMFQLCQSLKVSSWQKGPMSLSFQGLNCHHFLISQLCQSLSYQSCLKFYLFPISQLTYLSPHCPPSQPSPRTHPSLLSFHPTKPPILEYS